MTSHWEKYRKAPDSYYLDLLPEHIWRIMEGEISDFTPVSPNTSLFLIHIVRVFTINRTGGLKKDSKA